MLTRFEALTKGVFTIVAHDHSASRAKRRRASLSNALPNAKTPGFLRACASARPETSRAFFPTMMPLLHSRINAQPIASTAIRHGSRNPPSDSCLSINAPDSSNTRTITPCERL
jgi:hypothetical protein